jgi:hypothetical protein
MPTDLRLHETTGQDKLAVLHRQWSGCSISGTFPTVVRIESRKRDWLLQINHSSFKPTNTVITNISHAHVLKDKTRSQIRITYIFLQLLSFHYQNKRKLDTLDRQSRFMEYIYIYISVKWCLALEDSTNSFARNVGIGLPLCAASNPKTAQISFTSWRKPEITQMASFNRLRNFVTHSYCRCFQSNQVCSQHTWYITFSPFRWFVQHVEVTRTGFEDSFT